MRLRVRYDVPDAKGETRRQRNKKFGVRTPYMRVPQHGAHVWDWFWTLSARRRTGPEALSYAEVGEWQRLTKTQIRPEEVEMIMRMDNMFLSEMRKEQASATERQREEMSRRI